MFPLPINATNFTYIATKLEATLTPTQTKFIQTTAESNTTFNSKTIRVQNVTASTTSMSTFMLNTSTGTNLEDSR